MITNFFKPEDAQESTPTTAAQPQPEVAGGIDAGAAADDSATQSFGVVRAGAVPLTGAALNAELDAMPRQQREPAAGETSEAALAGGIDAAATTDAPAADDPGPSAPAPAAVKKPDPHNLRRFVSKAHEYHQQALSELQAGHKRSCWSWYVLPTPPFIKNGREVGSGTNRHFAIRSDAEAQAYLADELLRRNYFEVVSAMDEQLARGVKPVRLLGIDVPRGVASVNFMGPQAHAAGDEELSTLCERVSGRLTADPMADPKRQRSAP
jgi:uncharacterized protein (DUF1810 family)